MGKRVGVRIQNPNVWEEFKKFVVSKWGKKHTAMALELENALRVYMKQEEGYYETHTHTHKTTTRKSKEVSSRNGNTKPNSMYASSDNNGGPEVGKFPDSNELGIPPSEITKRRIVQHLKRNGMLDVEKINENAVRRVIGKEAGYDPRTINRYFDILEAEYQLPNIEYVDKRCLRKL